MCVQEKKSLGGAGDCEICKLVVEGVEKLIEDNSTEARYTCSTSVYHTVHM